ncbi:MAG: hypothetical protein K9M55_00945 [Candidatus Marinimicrobia bacterium]|nr:hypothetical protein [Candidatus Neomarinimicrobiota bacterium]
MRNIDQVREYLNVLLEEIDTPAKSGKGGHKEDWQSHTQKLDASLSELRDIVDRSRGEYN